MTAVDAAAEAAVDGEAEAAPDAAAEAAVDGEGLPLPALLEQAATATRVALARARTRVRHIGTGISSSADFPTNMHSHARYPFQDDTKKSSRFDTTAEAGLVQS